MRALAASSSVVPVFCALDLMFERSRSVSNEPGRMLLMVTLLAATRARDAGEESGQPGARAGRKIEAGERHLHRARGDVDDAAELALAPSGRSPSGSVRSATTMLAITPSIIVCRRQFAEIAERRTGIVVDQDVGVGTGGQQRLLTFRCRDVGDHRDHFGAGDTWRFPRRWLPASSPSRPLITTSQPASGQGARAGFAEPAARSADDGLAAGNSEIHGALIG